MSVLIDSELIDLLKNDPPLVSNIDMGNFFAPGSPVQAASIDLTVGEIFIPGTEKGKLGGIGSPRDSASLPEGRVAVIRTRERLNLPSNYMGLGFPPASLSVQGLLVTNPGQIDPGYDGHLHLTLINMSREHFYLRKGERIIRVVFLKLDRAPGADYPERHASSGSKDIIDEQLLNALSIDFLNVEKRSRDAIDASISKTQINSAIIAASVGVIVSLTAGLAPRMFDRYYALEANISSVSARVEVSGMSDRLKRLEEELSRRVTIPPSIPTTPAGPVRAP
jgi:dCTP deaminase